jgi:hypothetical protein
MTIEKDSDDLLAAAAEDIEFVNYENEAQLEHVMNLVTKDLSEPYSSTLNHWNAIVLQVW